MKARTLQLNWHAGTPVFAADFQPPGARGQFAARRRFATAGGDTNVRVWRLLGSDESAGEQQVEFLSNLSRHAAAVNVVRFSPDGDTLASAGDDGNIGLWRLAEAEGAAGGASGGGLLVDEDAQFNQEEWRLMRFLRGSTSDIYDLAWSPDGRFLVSGSIDNVARVWDVAEGKCIHAITDHKHFVQGVAWDPLNRYFATQSSDRSVNVYALNRGDSSGKQQNQQQRMFRLFARSGKMEVTKDSSRPASTVPAADKENSQVDATAVAETPSSSKRFQKIYHDENLTTFFRRCAFTPDGSLLLTPTGVLKDADGGEKKDGNNYCVFAYARNQLNKQPVIALPNHKRPTICVKPSPVKYALRDAHETQQQPWLALPYRMIFAVVTQDAVVLYDTQQTTPLAVLANLHYSTLTDLAWSHDGNTLVFTSTDGFCSMAVFDDDELGDVYVEEEKTTQPTADGSAITSHASSPKLRAVDANANASATTMVVE